MVVQHNMASANTNRQLGITNGNLAKSTEKLSSGYKINRAGDNAAGLTISEKMRGQIRGLEQASTNSQDGISLIQTAEGALSETQSILQRMRELTVQASNDTNVSADRSAITKELDALSQEVTRIASQTEFNTMKLLNGTFSGKNLQVGANSSQNITFSIKSMSASALGVNSISQQVGSYGVATKAITKVQSALNRVSEQRSALGALRTYRQLSLVSVTLIWLKKWLNTLRTASFSRQHSLCLHRLISLHREYYHYFSNQKTNKNRTDFIVSPIF